MVKLQNADKHLVAEQSSVSANPGIETAKNKRDPFLHLNHILHHMASIQVFLVLRKRKTKIPQRYTQSRLEICQKIYTTRFSGQIFYTPKVRKLRLFLLKEKQRTCIYISYFSNFFVKILTVSVQNHTRCV